MVTSTPLTIEELLHLRIVHALDGVLLIAQPDGSYLPIGQCNEEYRHLFASAAFSFQTLYQAQRALEVFLHDADIKGDDKLGARLQQICAHIDAALKIIHQGC